MFKLIKNKKNYFSCSDLIQKAMIKRRRLAYSAILNICDTEFKIRLVK